MAFNLNITGSKETQKTAHQKHHSLARTSETRLPLDVSLAEKTDLSRKRGTEVCEGGAEGVGWFPNRGLCR